ncbi:hypothetical protein FRC11_011029, partial [Ceratobasidium sp. 423]
MPPQRSSESKWSLVDYLMTNERIEIPAKYTKTIDLWPPPRFDTTQAQQQYDQLRPLWLRPNGASPLGAHLQSLNTSPPVSLKLWSGTIPTSSRWLTSPVSGTRLGCSAGRSPIRPHPLTCSAPLSMPPPKLALFTSALISSNNPVVHIEAFTTIWVAKVLLDDIAGSGAALSLFVRGWTSQHIWRIKLSK